jgi:plasmid rolling circle replication initiator protein Rep
MWRARFFQTIPKLVNDYPKGRFIFLTLTIKNCGIDELRETLARMNKAWTRLSQRKEFPALGWVKSMEVTRGADGTAHPHFHCLLMVTEGYFKRGYVSQAKWTELWASCLRVNYNPVVNVKVVKNKNVEDSNDPKSGLVAAVCETLKYGVKESDLVADPAWLLELTKQLHKTRAIAVGGCFRKYLSEAEPEDLIHGDQEPTEVSEDDPKITFAWQQEKKRYRKAK